MIGAFFSVPPPQQGPAQGAGRTGRILPFAVVAAVTVATYLVANWNVLTIAEGGLLLAMLGALVLGWALLPWDDLPRAAQLLLPAGAIAFIVVMQVAALPDDIDLAALMIAPVLWSALYGTAREALLVTSLAVGLIIALQAVATVGSRQVGLTGWTEVVAFCGGLVLLTYFTVLARSHARTDGLTGVANRRTWDEVLSMEIDRARRYAAPLAVAMIDLDHFKRFNDAHGHAEGDRHLVACTQAWSRCLRQSDVLARLGGEEFAVLLVGTDPDAHDVARRIIEATPGGESCSVGIAQWDGTEGPLSLMARADDALYIAKETGRGRVARAGAVADTVGHRPLPRVPAA